MEEAEKIFKNFDKDGDGRISKKELEQTFSTSIKGYSAYELDEIMKAMDGDKDGFIDINEWKAAAFLCSGTNHSHSDQKLREAFNFFDKESRGKISIEDFRKVLGKFDDDTWVRLI